jgi:tripeptidyl-peptidase I
MLVIGHPDYIGGTSASTPAVAGMFALINDGRLKAGLPPLGFLNPFIYSTYQQYQASSDPPPFLHIAQGNNGDTPCCIGFFASPQPGWSPIGGVGSINFDVLNKISLNTTSW